VFRGFKDTKTPLYANCKYGSFATTKWGDQSLRDVALGSSCVLVFWHLYWPLLLFFVLLAVWGNLVNVVLDPILMFALRFGVSGAAVATVLAQ
jgi:hypothetical protein